jgi:hypothetical protein
VVVVYYPFHRLVTLNFFGCCFSEGTAEQQPTAGPARAARHGREREGGAWLLATPSGYRPVGAGGALAAARFATRASFPEVSVFLI